MTPHLQTVFGDDPFDRYGNCFPTAIACLLDLHPDRVPHFMEFGQQHWEAALRLWLDARGQHLHLSATDPGGLCLALGWTASGFLHIVVWDGDTVHDPMPGGRGLDPARAPYRFYRITPDRAVLPTFQITYRGVTTLIDALDRDALITRYGDAVLVDGPLLGELPDLPHGSIDDFTSPRPWRLP